MLDKELYIFGAKSTAIGIIRAIRSCYPDTRIKGCIVSSFHDNPRTIEGIEIEELKDFSLHLTDKEKDGVNILIATPIYVQGEITDTLRMFGFKNIRGLSTDMEETLMHDYYERNNLFKSIKDISSVSNDTGNINILSVCHNADKRLINHYENPQWVKNIQVGASLTDLKLCEINDYTGDNISSKNPTYCELTALYWMWKNMINENTMDDYFGLYQYRRVLDLDERDFAVCHENSVDVVLPYPMIHVPDIKEHHTRYTNEEEWNVLLKAVELLSPEYSGCYEEIFSQQYMYNYNMFIAKGSVINEFCHWLFPIFFKTEELCKKQGIIPAKRYLAYFGESMTTWFFMKNKDRYNILHTGRKLMI